MIDDPVPTEERRDRDVEFARVALPLLPTVTRVARALTRDAADAEDLVQDTFLKAYQHWDSFVPGTDCRRWLATICRNTFLGQRSREKWVTAVGTDLELETFGAARVFMEARDQGISDMFARLDLAPAIASALAKLEPIFRAVATLVDVDGLTYEEVAVVLGIPIGTVRSRLYRARRQLQRSLTEFAVDAGFAIDASRTSDTSASTTEPSHAES